jgi:hypothetical protein
VVRFEENALPVVVLVFSAISSSAAPTLRVCSPDNWRDGVSLPPPTGSYSKLEWRQHSLFPDTLCAGGRPRTTNNGEVANSLPKRG